MAQKRNQRSSVRHQTDSRSKEMRVKAGNMMRNKASGVVDHSVVRPSIDVTVTGMRQALVACQSGTSEICQYLLDECNLIYECKVCLNLFRSLVNFVSHKRSFCQLKYSQTRHKDVRECAEVMANGPSEPIQTATVFVTPEDPVETLPPSSKFELRDYSPTIEMMREAGIIKEIENRPLFNQLKKPSIESIASKLKRKVEESFDVDYYATKELRLEKMRQTDKAVFQTEGLEGPTMGERYLAWQTEKQLATAFVGPDGKAVSPGDSQSSFSDSSKENNCNRRIMKKYICTVKNCCKTFLYASSIKRHLYRVHSSGSTHATSMLQNIKTKKVYVQVDESGHVITKVRPEQKQDLPRCPKCSRVFSNTSSVTNHVKYCNGVPMTSERRSAYRKAQKRVATQKIRACRVRLTRIKMDQIKKWTAICESKPDDEVVFKEDSPIETKNLSLSIEPLKIPKTLCEGRNTRPRPKSVALRQMKLTETKLSRFSLSFGPSTPIISSSDDKVDMNKDLGVAQKSMGAASESKLKITPLSNYSNTRQRGHSLSKELKELKKSLTGNCRRRR